MEKKYKLFVYGTLLNGEANHHRLGNALLIAAVASVNGSLVNTGCGYPALVLDSLEKVRGELYELNEEQLKNVDELEGFYGDGDTGNYYDRISIDVNLENRTERALTYVFSPGRARALERVESGDWRVFMQEGY